jgi:hypothetical protein
MVEDTEFTTDELELLTLAWALAKEGKVFCPEDAYLPECYRLSERGWLAREWHGDDLVYGWSAHAETALGRKRQGVGELTRLTKGSDLHQCKGLGLGCSNFVEPPLALCSSCRRRVKALSSAVTAPNGTRGEREGEGSDS